MRYFIHKILALFFIFQYNLLYSQIDFDNNDTYIFSIHGKHNSTGGLYYQSNELILNKGHTFSFTSVTYPGKKDYKNKRNILSCEIEKGTWEKVHSDTIVLQVIQNNENLNSLKYLIKGDNLFYIPFDIIDLRSINPNFKLKKWKHKRFPSLFDICDPKQMSSSKRTGKFP